LVTVEISMTSLLLDKLRDAIQKLTEAIWNLDQIELLTPELKEEYARIQLARENLMRIVKESPKK
jgi:hypothetical protein